jgi:hypothetical protein
VLAGMPEAVRIQRITSGLDKHNKEFVSLSVTFHNFGEARKFFSQLPVEKTMVEDFGREGGPRTQQPHFSF